MLGMDTNIAKLKLDIALDINAGNVARVREAVVGHPQLTQWTDINGGTALREAVAHGDANLEIIRLLVAWGSDVNAVDDQGLTPLMFAAMHGEREALTYLLDRGARDDLVDHRGRTAAEIADECGRREIAILLSGREQTRRAAAEKQAQEALEAEAAQAHRGIDHQVAVKKPLAFRKTP